MTKDNKSIDTQKSDTHELYDFAVEFRKYKTELTKKFLNRKPWNPPDESKILSFIPGTISKIYISLGEYVEEGQPLLILEAMKMKNIVAAHRSGRVKNINVVEGELVPKSKVIIELELA